MPNGMAGAAHPATGRRPCGLPRRMLVMLYDAVVVLALLMFAAGLALMLNPGRLIAGRDVLYTLYLMAFWFLYLAWCWRHGGMTLGMRAWRVRLVADSGGRIGWGQCALRFGCSLVSAALGGLGFLAALANPERRTWHDRASRTRLLDERPPPGAPAQIERRST